MDKNESVAQNRSGRAVQLCNEMDRRFFTYVRHSVLPRHSYDVTSLPMAETDQTRDDSTHNSCNDRGAKPGPWRITSDNVI